jgi:hypothetical protein
MTLPATLTAPSDPVVEISTPEGWAVSGNSNVVPQDLQVMVFPSADCAGKGAPQ